MICDCEVGPMMFLTLVLVHGTCAAILVGIVVSVWRAEMEDLREGAP